MFYECFSCIKLEVWVALCVTLAVCLVKYVRRFSMNLPPGPVGLPIVGYIPFLPRNVHLKFIELAEQYDKVFSLRLGSETVVVLNSTRSTREAFFKKEFLGRPPHGSFTVMGSKSPFLLQDMQLWQEQRRFVVHSMKDLGLGRSKIEENVQCEIRNFLQRLESYNRQAIDIKDSLRPSISNNICSLTFGKKYEYDDPERVLLNECVDTVIKAIGNTSLHTLFPWLRHFTFLLKWSNYYEAVLAYKRVHEIFESKILEHKKTLDPNNIRDFIDSYLIEISTQKAKDSDTTFTEEALIGCMVDLIGAGSETVRISISWSIYIMAAFPQVQERIHQEVRHVSGTNRLPEYEDLKTMPYTHAVILEIMRWKTVVPLNIFRYTLDDTKVEGYDIPRNTIIIANFWAVHHDPEFWKDPDSFYPERFLSPDGSCVVKSPHYMPFSVGKRACPGETMAYMEIFLYFTSIIQHFEIRFPKGVEPTFDAELNVTYNLNPYTVCMRPRDNL